jgi:hypothetical protein
MNIIHNNGKYQPVNLYYPPSSNEGGGGTSDSASYELVLGNVTSYLVTAATHGLINVNDVTILNSARAKDDVYTEIRANGDVYIESNVPLINYTLIINGELVLSSYEATLASGLSFLITAATHGVFPVKGATILRPDRVKDDIYMELRANGDVYLESNVNLLNFIIKIY